MSTVGINLTPWEGIMGDRSAVEITLYGVAGHEQKLVELSQDGWSDDESWGGPGGVDDPAYFVDGAKLCDIERSVGSLDPRYGADIFPELEKLGISYYACQEGKYEFGAEVRMFTPELGAFQQESSGEGAVTVPAWTIDKAIDVTLHPVMEEVPTDYQKRLETLVGHLARVTGKAWRDRFAELDEAIEARKVSS